MMMMMYTLLIFPIFQSWIANQRSWIPLPNIAWMFCYGIYMAIFAYFPLIEIVHADLPPASTVIVVAEQVGFS